MQTDMLLSARCGWGQLQAASISLSFASLCSAVLPAACASLQHVPACCTGHAN